jgi:osmoprotectant transport system substrate-binding protein
MLPHADYVVPVSPWTSCQVPTTAFDDESAAMTTEDLVEMNGRLANHDDIGAGAADWLTAHKLN